MWTPPTRALGCSTDGNNIYSIIYYPYRQIFNDDQRHGTIVVDIDSSVFLSLVRRQDKQTIVPCVVIFNFFSDIVIVFYDLSPSNKQHVFPGCCHIEQLCRYRERIVLYLWVLSNNNIISCHRRVHTFAADRCSNNNLLSVSSSGPGTFRWW